MKKISRSELSKKKEDQRKKERIPKYQVHCCGFTQEQWLQLNRISYILTNLEGKTCSVNRVVRMMVQEYLNNNINEYNKKMMEIFDV